MSKTTKKLSMTLVFMTVIAMMVMLVAVADYSGIEANVSWTLDTSSGTLTLSGSGAMPAYENGSAPWYQYKSNVKSIVVNSGVTISKGAFYGMDNLKTLTIPYVGDGNSNTYFGYIFGASNYFQNPDYVPESLSTVIVNGTDIANYAFNNVNGVEKVILGDTVKTVGSNAFKDCAELKYIVFGSGIKTISSNALLRCNSLVYAFFNGTSTGWAGVTVDSTNYISPVYLASGSLAVTAPAKTVYGLGESLDLTGFAATFANVDVTTDVEVIAPDTTTIGTKAVTVYFGTKSATFNITVESNGTAGVSGVITWSVSGGVLTLSGEGMMDNYTLETLAPWYAMRDAITTVKVGEGITSVGAYAFYGLEDVTSITLPVTIETIDYAAFENCSALTSLTLGNMSAVVDGTAFRNCTGLVTIVGASKYAKVSNNAYYALIEADKAATSFTVPTTTVVIAEGAFENAAVTSITLPASVITVGDNAFASSALTSATLGTGVKHIGNYAFVDCSALAKITFNAVPDYVGAGAFSATAITGTSYKNAVYLGTADNAYAILWKAEGTDFVSCSINSNTKVIASLAFANHSTLEAVQLPAGLLHIGDSAFNSCTALYSVRLPSTVVSIGDAAFKGCTSLASIKLSTGLKTIGNSAFRGTALSEVVLDAQIENVGYNAYRDCTSLTKLVFNANSGIGYKTFANCTALNDIYLADSVASIGDYAFAGCSALNTIAIPDTTSTIGYGVLYGNKAVKNLAVPTSASAEYLFGSDAPTNIETLLVGSDIENGAFDGIAIGTLLIDKTVTAIGSDAFEAPAAVYYLGSSEEWAAVTGNTALSNVLFADSTFKLVSNQETYEVGELLDRAKFVATIGETDVTALLRFTANPVTSSEPFLPAKIGTLVAMFKAQIIDEIEFTNYSLLLEGSIGVKFYVKISQYVIDDIDKITAHFDYIGSTYEAELVKAENTVDGTIYVTKFYVPAKEMIQPITLTVNTPNYTESITRSVKDYVDYVNTNPDNYTECITLINEMFNYGEYSRHYFEKATITPNPDLSDVEVTISDSYTPVKKGDVDGITLSATSLLLESNTTVRHYFTLADGASISDYTFNVNGVKVVPQKKDGMYYVEIDNIIARSLGKLDKTVITKADSTMVITYSPLSYVKLALEKRAESDPDLACLVKALYRYYVAAADYFVDITDDIEPGEDESKPSIW